MILCTVQKSWYHFLIKTCVMVAFFLEYHSFCIIQNQWSYFQWERPVWPIYTKERSWFFMNNILVKYKESNMGVNGISIKKFLFCMIQNMCYAVE